MRLGCGCAFDTTLGLTPGGTIKTFESTALATGLQVRAMAAAGSCGPVSTLPNLFDASADPAPERAFFSYPCGVAADCSSLWDGTHSSVNTYTNTALPYGNSANWGDIELLFAGGVKRVGFGMQQIEVAVTVFVNGASVPEFTIPGDGNAQAGRAGYFRIDLSGGSLPITSLRLSNGNSGDGWAIDHLAFTPLPVPEPGTWALCSAGLTSLGAVARRNR